MEGFSSILPLIVTSPSRMALSDLRRERLEARAITLFNLSMLFPAFSVYRFLPVVTQGSEYVHDIGDYLQKVTNISLKKIRIVE
jgi:hypothetical protein